MTLRRQMILLIAGPTLLIYLAILGFMVVYTYRESKDARQRTMMELAAGYAARLDGKLREAAQIATTTADFLGTAGAPADEQIYEQLQRNVARSLPVYGACLAFEPGTLKPAGELFAPYVCRSDTGGYRRVNIDRSVYDWYGDPKYTWYSRPKLLGQSVWSEPYFDEGAGNVLMITFSAPFYRRDGKFGGVATVDIDLPRMQQTVGREFEQDLDFFILSTDGRFVYDDDASRILAKTIFDIAAEKQRPALEALGRRMVQGTSGIVSIDGWDAPERQWVCFAPIKSTKWVFACRLPESQILADVRSRTIWSAAALAITLVLIGTCIVVASRFVSAPIARLKDKVLEVGTGNLDVRIDASSRADELRTLATSFNRMTTELRAHVERLTDERAARARIEHDLDIAHEIQQSLLPNEKPDVPGYEFSGWTKPADKTGGDYYDWQTRGDGRTLVTLADVTGHGVGPALVTAVCRAYVRASFVAGRDLTSLMEHLNDLLVADLPDNRFVTFAAAMVDPAAHSIELMSAGHGPLYHYIAAEHRLAEFDANGMPLGVLAPANFDAPSRLNMAPGDVVLFITDGFFEWANPDGELFGLERLRSLVLDVAQVPIDEIIPRIYAVVESFAEGVAQEDDVTAVVMKRARA